MRTPGERTDRRCLVIIHSFGDGLGSLADGLRRRGFFCAFWHPASMAEPPLALRDIALLIVLGGAANVGEEAHRDWQAREAALLQRALDADMPILAICFGAQMLAQVLGARVYTMAAPEIGLMPIRPTTEGHLLQPLAAVDYRVYQWHGDAFNCPAGATRLADFDATRCQAFRYGTRVLATQFHIEVTREIFDGWRLDGPTPSVDDEALDRQLEAHGRPVEAACAAVFDAWLAEVFP